MLIGAIRIDRILVRAVALTGIFVGFLNLFGIRPMNSRTVQVVLGTGAVVLGIALLRIAGRGRAAAPPTSLS
jgi:hypothetical protein